MDSARIAALLQPFLDRPLTPGQLTQISTYIDLLLRWNARINLTAIRNPEEIVTRHFGESLFLARHLFPARVERTPPSAPEPLEQASTIGHFRRLETQLRTQDSQPVRSELAARSSQLTRVIDLGSGAGFPALPLKIWDPTIHLTLIESNHKKAAFLREATRALTLTNVDVIADRAETLSSRTDSEFPKAEVVTFRAVEQFERTLPLAASFLSPTARLAVLIGSAQLPQLTALTDLIWRIIPIPQSRTRILSIGEESI